MIKYTHLKQILLNVLFIINISNAYAGVDTGNTATQSSDSDSLTSYSAYETFEYSDSINWGDCFDFSVLPSMGICPAMVPYPSFMTIYEYYDIVAMVEVVPDPWKSYLYGESFYNFSNKNTNNLTDRVGSSSVMGSGYNGSGKSNAKENIGQHKYESHVWAIGDYARLGSSSFSDGCLSLTCKNEDYTGCVLSVLDSTVNVSEGMTDTISSVNSDTQGSEGQGQGVVNGETGEITYEDGSVYNKNEDGVYEQTRGPGNPGVNGLGKSADVGTSTSSITGQSQAYDFSNQVGSYESDYKLSNSLSNATDQLPENSSSGNSYGTHTFCGCYSDALTKQSGENTYEVNYDGETTKHVSLPSSTKSNSSAEHEPSQVDSSSEVSGNSYQTSNNVSNNNFGTTNSGNQSAKSQLENKFSGQMGNSMNAQQAWEIIDRITYFNATELVIQYIAAMIPLNLHPVFMSERHEKASATGGFFWGPIAQSAAGMGAGLIMPIFCMSQSLGMAVDGVADFMFGSDLNMMDKLGSFGTFIQNRCVGSWGPLEPRVNLIGSGDPFVAAGLASARSLNIAQNITGNNFNKSINNTPFSELTYNLEWPHQSSCYNFDGFSGLSRGWTTPVGGALDDVSSAVQSGDTSQIAAAGQNATIDQARKQGGYVFTYWRKRKCYYLWSCELWLGDTGL